ncbi:MAG: hypothetical protein A2Y10_06165 [Planctomycetes bacterium GWF2_41_51]|nr:MAG: hypothetical protein A2Y10_06165 [Planctomycetes bacterium GWF2_41_51]HBG26471.1 hypothetical protein [Phycisphaerales bacterium]
MSILEQEHKIRMRNNILKAIHFDCPDYIPMMFIINEASWYYYPEDFLYRMMDEHRFLFPSMNREMYIKRSTCEEPGKPFTDGWGCVWETMVKGIVGEVTKHPLKDWSDFGNYKSPNPLVDSGKGPINWSNVKQDLDTAKANNELAIGRLRHGHTFLNLVDIRGYENLMFDFHDNVPQLGKLIAMLEDFNMALVKNFVDRGAEMIKYPEDLGAQTGPMITPQMFRKYIRPSYERLYKYAIDRNIIVHVHSDGNLHLFADDLIALGVNVLNLQDTVNGIDWIRDNLKGKVCLELDIDRQNVTAFGTPQQIDDFVRLEIKTLSSKEGGLMMIYDLYPNVPLENIKAVMDAMEKYAFS